MTEIQQPHFWPILEALPYPVMYKDLVSPSIFANNAAQRLFNLSPENATAMVSMAALKAAAICNTNTQQPYSLFNNPLIQALSGNEISQHVLVAKQAASYHMHSRLISLPFTLHQSVIISLQRTEPTTIESSDALYSEEIQEALAFDKLISLISTELINVQEHELDMHINDALAAVGEFCHADRAYVFQFNNELTEMSNTNEWVRHGVTSHIENLQQIPQQALPYFYQIMQNNFIFSVSDVTQLPAEAKAEKEEFDREDIRSVLCCAMRAGDKVIGFVGCDMVSRTRVWTSNDLRRLKLVGEMIANTLQNVAYRRSLQSMQQQLLTANAELQQQAMQDGLTGIANRRQFDQCLQQELHRSARSETPLSLVMLDIDRFKPYNDHYGHQAGDDALKQLATCLTKVLKRQGDIAARYGGEEFALILPDSTLEDAVNVSKQIQQLLIELAIEHKHSDISNYLTVSIGCCSVVANKDTEPSQLIKAADKALYAAKTNGRNRIET
ncbi:sensor domain-containing diguanylate cyclase [Rheinheimera salexigens]|uniref:diguanylate cyclase n=1 Tax=Rheinheimera salexigens TaxID=1628148 RepID=A0A1E7Q4W2_9GAMM|nr:sensor domain-containing diguanylate cyclase [Rheinheimera salexigens]OEY69234.1 two-component system, chemotaxis family, response regulator WspR [Rheinheimera salexigens]